MSESARQTKVDAAAIAGVRGRIIYTTGPDRVVDLADGVLAWDANGRIVACEPYDHYAGRGWTAQPVHVEHRLVIPGLVDCHLHLPQLDQRARFGLRLLDWLEKYIMPAESAFADPAVADDVGRRFFKKLILNGTTTSSIYGTVHKEATEHAFELARIAGVRAIIGKVMMDRHAPLALAEDSSASLDASVELASRWHGAEGGRLRYAFSPRFAPTCSMHLLSEVGRAMQKTDVYLQSHIAETIDESALVRELFPRLRDYFALFEETGIAGPRSILGHAIHLTDDEYRRMAKSGTKIAHCPTSNFFLKSGSMPMLRVEAAGVTFGLGTDIGAGTSMSLFSEMRHADFAQIDMHLSPVKALYLATLAGARALSMDDEIGSLEIGKFADFCVVDVKRIDYYYRLADLDTLGVLALIMYRGDGHIVESTHVAGRRLDVDALNV